MSNSEEQLQENSYSFIMDLLDLFIKIMDSKLEKGCLKKDILQDIQLIINVLLLIHRHIGFSRENNFNLLNMSLKDYIEELLPYLYSHSYLNLKYVLDLEDFKVDIGTMAYLGIMIYEFLFNVLSYDIMEKKYTNVSITLRREKNNGILRIRNEYGDLDNPNRKDLNIISYHNLIHNRLSGFRTNQGRLRRGLHNHIPNIKRLHQQLEINLNRV